jgi:hypothetical protein
VQAADDQLIFLFQQFFIPLFGKKQQSYEEFEEVGLDFLDLYSLINRLHCSLSCVALALTNSFGLETGTHSFNTHWDSCKIHDLDLGWEA